MEFTLGNLVVLGIVIIILALYRRLDANNRSLELIRKYAEKAQKELDAVVEEKAQSLRDIGIEVDVHKRTAEEILKRSQGIQEEIKGNNSAIDSLGLRIKEYDHVLDELMQMTRRAEENLGRIKEESEFVDSVAKRVRTAASKMEELEAGLPALLQRFQTSNTENLMGVQKNLLDSAAQKTQILAGEIKTAEAKAEEMTRFMKTAEAENIRASDRMKMEIQNFGNQLVEKVSIELAQIEKDYGAKLQEAASRGEALETFAFSKLKEHIEGKLRGVSEELVTRINSGKTEIEAKMGGLDSFIETMRGEAEASLEAIKSGNAQALREYETSVRDKLDSLEGSLYQAERDFEGKIAALGGKIEGVSRELVARIDSDKTEIEAKMGGLDSFIETMRGEAEASIEAIKSGNAQALREYETSVKDKIDSLEGSLYQAEKDFEGKIAALEGKHDEAITEYGASINSKIAELEEAAEKSEKTFEARIVRLDEENSRRLEALASRAQGDIEEKTENLRAEVQERVERAREAADLSRASLEEAFSGLQNRVDGEISRLGESLAAAEKRAAEFSSGLESFVAESRDRISGETEEVSRRFASFAGEISQRGEEINSTLDELENSLREKAESASGRMDSRLQEFLKDYEVKVADMRAEGERLCEEALQQCRDIALRNEEHIRQQLTAVSQGLEHTAGVGRALEEKTQNLDACLKRFEEEYETRITETGEALQSRIIGGLEERLGDYQKDIAYKFSSIEEVFGEIGELENKLKEHMEKISQKLQGEFTAFGKALHEKRLADKVEADKVMQELQEAMSELEGGIMALKAKAHDNMSAKLKILEDDFFQDLRQREDAMQERLSVWQADVDVSLEKLAEKNAEERDAAEARYSENLKERFSEFKGRMEQLFGTWEERFGEFQRGLASRMDTSNSIFESFRSGVEEKLTEAKAASENFLKEETSRQAAALERDLVKFTKEYEAKLKTMTGAFEEKSRELRAQLEALKSETALGEAGVLQKIKECEADVGNQVTSLKVSVSDTVASLQEEFTRQKNELIHATREERAALKDELRRLDSEAGEMEENFRRTSETTLSGLESRLSEFNEKFMRETNAFQTEAEEKIRVFRTGIQDTREQFDAQCKKLFGQLDDKAGLLGANLTEIDKRQKNFIEQTKIFERADSLKESLRESVEELKAGIERTDAHRKEIRGIEEEFLQIRKLGEKVSERMARFTAEKRRFDTLEEDYQRLIAMSESVEQKLQRLYASDDAIENMQAAFRTLETQQAEVDARFERLEKKRRALDLTAEGIEKNQAGLDSIGKRIEQLRGEVAAMPANVNEVSRKLDAINSEKDKLDNAVKQMAEMKSLMADLEKRAEKLQKSREWLAKAETRMEEINRKSQERLKLLENLTQDKGAPAAKSIQDTVRRLSHEGWTVDAIAQTTKLGRGQVELILEMGPDPK
ncbi:MAG: hypothetical protein LBC67_07225 [Spirochaetales bacterium]|jgi:chromosome segregation ATPase|nr:hypothetical protein [Spirochaetales bacterium]